ncbi:MAG: CpsB/CapC family capsule biosynthesis tyrosine phosphatase [Myxococcota bacterium]
MNLDQPGYVDLHSHYVPAVDDGVRSAEDGAALCRGLKAIGFSTVVATPHIRSAMFPNSPAGLRAAHAAFAEDAAGDSTMPQLGLGAEHFYDEHLLELVADANELTYTGGKAVLIELPTDAMPYGVAETCFRLKLRGVAPVLAHPERYRPLFRKSDPIDGLTDAGALPLLDLMSLVGRYGRRPKAAAERMLDEDVYYAACSDAHRPADVELVAKAIDVLKGRMGPERAEELLAENPRHILRGSAEY